MQTGSVWSSRAIPGVKTKKTQDAQIVFRDPRSRLADEAGKPLPDASTATLTATGATAPACPAFNSNPTAFSLMSGGYGQAQFTVSGNLVGQSTNTALQPDSCTVSVSGPVTAKFDPSGDPVSFDFQIASGAAPEVALLERRKSERQEPRSPPVPPVRSDWGDFFRASKQGR